MHINSSFTSESELKEKLDFIFAKSKEGKSFTGIMEVAFNEITIITAIHNIKANKGSNTPGVDNNKIDKYLQMDREELIQLISSKAFNYKPHPVRREYIKKDNGKFRPLGIPTVIDRIIQECIRIVIEPICEAKFYPHSYGFRPYRACKHAITNIIYKVSNGGSKESPVHVIEGDIKGYFDNIDHRILLNKVWKIGIHDKRILCIIKQMLKAGYIENDFKYISTHGTPQGGILSPILANIYLNNFDWTIGRMYETPIQRCKDLGHDRQRLVYNGVIPKYLTRYADDWVIMTKTEKESQRILKYLKKYFRYRLKLELSEDKTTITNMKEKPIKFLGCLIKAELPRKTPTRPNPTTLVGKAIPNPEKVKKQVKEICREIKQLKQKSKPVDKAIQIERINTKIVGISEYWKSFLCSLTFHYIDDKIFRCSNRVFRKLDCEWEEVPMKLLSNRPQRHKDYNTPTFAIKVDDMYIGITRSVLTGSHWSKKFNQEMTPYTSNGRDIYKKDVLKRTKAQLDRPPIYDIQTLISSKKYSLYNFEYMMNREYAYNRDKGKCRCCGLALNEGRRHCHHIDNKLPQNMINKVSNLTWVCNDCHKMIHGTDIPETLSKKIKIKIQKFKTKIA